MGELHHISGEIQKFMSQMLEKKEEKKMDEIEKKRLGEAIDYTISHSLIYFDGKVMALGDALRLYRGGNYLATKWRKCSEKQPETARPALVYLGGGYIEVDCWNGKKWIDCGGEEMHPTHWMNLPLPPVPEG